MEPSFRNYQIQVLKNSKAMAQALLDHGYELVSGTLLFPLKISAYRKSAEMYWHMSCVLVILSGL